MTEPTELMPCPFCGAGESQIHVNKGTWNGRGYGEPVSVEVRHWCADVPGQPSRMISRAGRDTASAIAAWNTRAPQPTRAQAGAGQPVAWLDPWRADQVTTDYDAYGEHGIALYTAPQPVEREPLTHAQAKALVLKYGNDPLHLVLQVERHHGIKGGQHVGNVD